MKNKETERLKEIIIEQAEIITTMRKVVKELTEEKEVLTNDNYKIKPKR